MLFPSPANIALSSPVELISFPSPWTNAPTADGFIILYESTLPNDTEPVTVNDPVICADPVNGNGLVYY